MPDSTVVFLVFVAVVVIVAIYIASIYNALVRLRNHISDAWSNVDTELLRRYELIPNLVAAVKGYAAHERETLERVIELRNTCIKADGNFLELQKELVNTEDRSFFDVDPTVRIAPAVELA
jgi:LemA protein